MPYASLLTISLALMGPRGDAPPPPPPGGYYGIGELPETPPPDGERSLITGSIVFPLGLLRTAMGFVQLELASPERCTYTASSCQGLTTYGYIGVGTGAVMIATGATFLGIGLSRRRAHRRWKAARNLAWRVENAAISRGGGLALRLSF